MGNLVINQHLNKQNKPCKSWDIRNFNLNRRTARFLKLSSWYLTSGARRVAWISFPLIKISVLSLDVPMRRKFSDILPHVFSNVFGFDSFLNLFFGWYNFNKFKLYTCTTSWSYIELIATCPCLTWLGRRSLDALGDDVGSTSQQGDQRRHRHRSQERSNKQSLVQNSPDIFFQKSYPKHTHYPPGN